VNSATRKAEKAPMARQSRRDCGWKKLTAKMMKIAELTATSSQRPYAWVVSVPIVPLSTRGAALGGFLQTRDLLFESDNSLTLASGGAAAALRRLRPLVVARRCSGYVRARSSVRRLTRQCRPTARGPDRDEPCRTNFSGVMCPRLQNSDLLVQSQVPIAQLAMRATPSPTSRAVMVTHLESPSPPTPSRYRVSLLLRPRGN
jgi:hypothetical protein